ncbi:phosphatidylinositol glycan, class K [Saprolegnia diclina VS20]|uniref:Phosphatidylinositol glycan, class K n=1 Tax=Saprolegnia diclina (strain VS20) TaxID=1156394 RepID=T0S4P4_SAPDV|nr:phosphatidylinositol glycan, class K [Saprolegnia diclina VS20]EQC39993.1 phosphatidylinositol glycan, class K [Saprolegnia diclina VS20]|eukprot:XP_008606467.1 phosphatidylinositol glycan, class K [Saprolegnia diclina VS20]
MAGFSWATSSFLLLLLVCAMGYERHTNNWAVIVDASRFWFNYRHITNALSLYHSVKRLGIPDSQIVLMLADQMPCNARNCYPGHVFNSNNHAINLYGEDVEVDYRGDEVNVANFIKVLTGRHEPGTPANRRLDSDEKSNVFVFMTGHGGDGFLKFQDVEELSSHDIADSIEEMHVKGRYNELFFMVDTCQAGSLAKQLYSPNVVTIGSASTGQNSYAYHTDFDIGLSLIDRFTYATLDFLQAHDTSKTLADLFGSYDPRMLYSDPEARTELLHRPLHEVPVTDFLGSVLHVELDDATYPLAPPTTERPANVASYYDLTSPDAADGSSKHLESSPAMHLDLDTVVWTSAVIGVATLLVVSSVVL